jgi:hypothetical protein
MDKNKLERVLIDAGFVLHDADNSTYFCNIVDVERLLEAYEKETSINKFIHNSREQFEAWFCDGLRATLVRKDDGYVLMSAQIQWNSWQERDILAKLEREELIMQCAGLAWDDGSVTAYNQILALLEVKE